MGLTILLTTLESNQVQQRFWLLNWLDICSEQMQLTTRKRDSDHHLWAITGSSLNCANRWTLNIIFCVDWQKVKMPCWLDREQHPFSDATGMSCVSVSGKKRMQCVVWFSLRLKMSNTSNPMLEWTYLRSVSKSSSRCIFILWVLWMVFGVCQIRWNNFPRSCALGS